MKKSIFTFAVIVIVLSAILVLNRFDFCTLNGVSTAGGGLSLKELCDTTKTNVTALAQMNTTSEENLVQFMTIGSWEHQYNSFYTGADIVGTVSTQFGVMCPTYDVRAGLDFNAFRLEAKIGNFTRNMVTTVGFDPQFSNFCILSGESAPVSNAVQLSLTGKSTRLLLGHQGGSKFYTFDGNYYACVEQKIGHLSLSGGMDFTENLTGYAAVKWMCHNDNITMTGNKLGTEDRNVMLSYVHNNIPVCKGINMNLGSALWMQQEKNGMQLVAGLNKGNFTLFTQTGGYLQSNTFTPMFGLGLNLKL